MKRILILLAMAIISTVHARDELDLSKPSGKLERYMQDVIFGWDRLPRSARWISLPSLELTSSDPELKSFAERTFNEITQETKLASSDTFHGKLEVYIGDTNYVKEIAAKNNIKVDLKNYYTTTTYWMNDENPVVTRVVLLLCSDQIKGVQAQDALLRAMVFSFGLSGKSREFDESCLTLKQSIITKLTPLDKKALSFFYGNVPPGTSKSDFKKLFEESWGKL